MAPWEKKLYGNHWCYYQKSSKDDQESPLLRTGFSSAIIRPSIIFSLKSLFSLVKIENEFTVQDCFTIVFMLTLTQDSDIDMASLDNDYLLTNISLVKTTDISVNKLF